MRLFPLPRVFSLAPAQPIWLRAGSVRRAPHGVTLVALLTVAICTGCGECKTDQDCGRDGDVLLQCSEEKTCEPSQVRATPSCLAAEDCPGGEENAACLDGACHFKPACQRLEGSWSYQLRCDDGGDVSETLTPSFAACTTTLDFSGFTVSFTLPSQNASVVTTVGNRCETVAYDSVGSALFLSRCELGTATCDIVLHSETLDEDACLLPTPNSCAGSCAPLDALSDVVDADGNVPGVCQ